MTSQNKHLSWLFILLFFATPLIFSSLNSELFELPKFFFIYALTILLIFFHLQKVLTRQKALFYKSPLSLIFLIFIISQLLSTLFSIDIHTSFFGYYSRLNGGLLSLLSFFALFLILPLYLDSKLKNLLLKATLLSSSLVSIYAVAQHFGIDAHLWVQDVQNRVFSTLGQPNWLAAYLALVLPLSAFYTLTSQKNSLRLLYFSHFNLLFLALLFTKSKSGIIATLISLSFFFTYSFFLDLKNKNSFKSYAKYLIFLLPLLFALTINNPVKDYLLPKTSTTPVLNDPNNPTLNITSSKDIRAIVWKASLDLWKQYPLFGTGTETFAYSYYWTRPAEHNLTSEWNYLYNKAHNEYLNYMATTGTFGTLSYLLLILFSLFTLLKPLFSQNTSQEKRLFSFTLFSSYLSILITNAAGFSVAIISLYFFLLPLFNKDHPLIDPKTQKSLSFFQKLLLIIPTLFLLQKVLYFHLADLSYQNALIADSKQMYQEARSDILASLSYRPQEPVYLSKTGSIYAKLALTQKNPSYIEPSLKYLDAATKISPFSLNLWKEQAQSLYYLADLDPQYYQLAITALENASKIAPTDAKTFYLLGNFYKDAKDYPKAAEYYQQAIELKSNYDHAYFALAQTQILQKNYQDALLSLQQVLKLTPQNQEAQDLIDKIEKL